MRLWGYMLLRYEETAMLLLAFCKGATVRGNCDEKPFNSIGLWGKCKVLTDISLFGPVNGVQPGDSVRVLQKRVQYTKRTANWYQLAVLSTSGSGRCRCPPSSSQRDGGSRRRGRPCSCRAAREDRLHRSTTPCWCRCQSPSHHGSRRWRRWRRSPCARAWQVRS